MPRTISIVLSDFEEIMMADMVIDIDRWFNTGPYKEKIANHEKRIIGIMRERLKKQNKESSISEKELVHMYFADPNYKNRKQREEEAKLEALERFNQKNKPA